MTTNNPITVDGIVFDRVAVSLSISTRIVDGIYTAGAACRLVPCRVLEDGTSEELQDQARSVLIGDTAALAVGSPERDAMSAIYEALQTFITVKGL